MRNSLIILFCFFFPSLIFSQEKRVALVIGNANYQKGATLPNPGNDAEDMEKHLKLAGFDVSLHVDLGQSDMKKVIDEFGASLEKAEVGLFFYAGHGVQAKGRNYLIPVDAALNTENDVEYNCVDAGRILAKMEDANTSTNIVILDACRNNPFERSWSRNSNGNGLAFMNAPSGSLIAYSTAPGKTASDGYKRNSPYTEGLLEYISIPNLKIEDLFKLVRIKVIDKTNGQQEPWESTSMRGDFYFNADRDKTQTTLNDILPATKEQLVTKETSNKITDYESHRQNLAASIRSIAVMPFSNYTGDESKAYIAYGIQDALIGELGQLGSIRITSTTSTLPYADFQKSLKDVANELNVDGIVEASLFGAGEKLKVQLKLYSALPEEELLWTESYESDLRHIYNFYTEVVKNIADEIQLALSEEKLTDLEQERTINPEAYKAYLQGKFNMGMLTQEGIQSALEYYNKAIEIDPEYGIAYAGIAGVWVFLKQMDFVSVEMANPFIKENIEKAIQYDDQSAEIFYWLAAVNVWTDFDWEKGENAFKKCLEINPNHAEAWAYYSHLLMFLNRDEEMWETMHKARNLDPNNVLTQALEGVVMMRDQEFDACINTMTYLQQLMPTNPLLITVLSQCYSETGQYELAINEFGKLIRHYLADNSVIEQLNEDYQKIGFEKALNNLGSNLEELEKNNIFVSPKDIWIIFLYANNIEKTLYWLERAFIRNSPDNPYITSGPAIVRISKEPRYIELVKGMNLPVRKFE